jgi:hypothetical protein
MLFLYFSRQKSQEKIIKRGNQSRKTRMVHRLYVQFFVTFHNNHSKCPPVFGRQFCFIYVTSLLSIQRERIQGVENNSITLFAFIQRGCDWDDDF